MIIPHETEPLGYRKQRKRTNSNTDARRLTQAASYEAEADEIMVWAGWYYRMGFIEDANKQRKMAEDRYAHAKKLRGREE